MSYLPRKITHVGVPPIKCQGIKTRLVPFIAGNVYWKGNGKWIEPFLGSGAVLFNLRPQKVLACDNNIHLIRFYRDIQEGVLDEAIVRSFLEETGSELYKKGADFYYEMRDEFNRAGGSLRFLFLNRSCFNGVMRFNAKACFNVPFGHKPNRFRKGYITKICNQVKWVRKAMEGKEWEFRTCDWKEALKEAQTDDFIYMDPPYAGRHTGYYNVWPPGEAEELSRIAQSRPGGFALSMWLRNKYRRNPHIEKCWRHCEIRTTRHFYHVGPGETLRNDMEEALVIKRGFAAEIV